jgi:ORF6N domain
MKKKALQAVPTEIDSLIVEVRGQKVILDSDLASIYGVPTKRLNEQVKRNARRFPLDFLFRLTVEETEQCQRSRSQIATLEADGGIRSQFATASKRNIRYLPAAFTEHGALMAANVLNSPRAVDMSVFVVRAFVKMRSAFGDTRQLPQKLALLEQELTSRLDVHEAAIVDVLQRIMKSLDPPPPPPEPPPLEIGFHVKEDAVPYRIKRRPVRGR